MANYRRYLQLAGFLAICAGEFVLAQPPGDGVPQTTSSPPTAASPPVTSSTLYMSSINTTQSTIVGTIIADSSTILPVPDSVVSQVSPEQTVSSLVSELLNTSTFSLITETPQITVSLVGNADISIALSATSFSHVATNYSSIILPVTYQASPTTTFSTTTDSPVTTSSALIMSLIGTTAASNRITMATTASTVSPVTETPEMSILTTTSPPTKSDASAVSPYTETPATATALPANTLTVSSQVDSSIPPVATISLFASLTVTFQSFVNESYVATSSHVSSLTGFVLSSPIANNTSTRFASLTAAFTTQPIHTTAISPGVTAAFLSSTLPLITMPVSSAFLTNMLSAATPLPETTRTTSSHVMPSSLSSTVTNGSGWSTSHLTLTPSSTIPSLSTTVVSTASSVVVSNLSNLASVTAAMKTPPLTSLPTTLPITTTASSTGYLTNLTSVFVLPASSYVLSSSPMPDAISAVLTVLSLHATNISAATASPETSRPAYQTTASHVMPSSLSLSVTNGSGWSTSQLTLTPSSTIPSLSTASAVGVSNLSNLASVITTGLETPTMTYFPITLTGIKTASGYGNIASVSILPVSSYVLPSSPLPHVTYAVSTVISLNVMKISAATDSPETSKPTSQTTFSHVIRSSLSLTVTNGSGWSSSHLTLTPSSTIPPLSTTVVSTASSVEVSNLSKLASITAALKTSPLNSLPTTSPVTITTSSTRSLTNLTSVFVLPASSYVLSSSPVPDATSAVSTVLSLHAINISAATASPETSRPASQTTASHVMPSSLSLSVTNGSGWSTSHLTLIPSSTIPSLSTTVVSTASSVAVSNLSNLASFTAALKTPPLTSLPTTLPFIITAPSTGPPTYLTPVSNLPVSSSLFPPTPLNVATSAVLTAIPLNATSSLISTLTNSTAINLSVSSTSQDIVLFNHTSAITRFTRSLYTSLSVSPVASSKPAASNTSAPTYLPYALPVTETMHTPTAMTNGATLATTTLAFATSSYVSQVTTNSPSAAVFGTSLSTLNNTIRPTVAPCSTAFPFTDSSVTTASTSSVLSFPATTFPTMSHISSASVVFNTSAVPATAPSEASVWWNTPLAVGVYVLSAIGLTHVVVALVILYKLHSMKCSRAVHPETGASTAGVATRSLDAPQQELLSKKYKFPAGQSPEHRGKAGSGWDFPTVEELPVPATFVNGRRIAAWI